MDLISRQEAIDAVCKACSMEGDYHKCDGYPETSTWCDELVALRALPSAQQWIPVKTRPMTQKEKEYYETDWDVVLDDEEAVLFDCPMPEDNQTIWVTTKNGYLFRDTCENDGGYIGLEGNGDWYDIAAWMPVLAPEPYKESKA